MNGIPQIGPDAVARLILGTNRHTEVNAEDNANDYAAVDDKFKNSRVIYCDEAGVIRYAYYDDTKGVELTETAYLQAGVFYQVRNLRKVYKATKSNAACTAKIYIDSTGDKKIGLKARR
jgi:hypothetical protein